MRDGKLLVGGRPVEPERRYRVAGSDFEFEPFWGYVGPDWGVQPTYEVPTILREALEEYLTVRGPVRVGLGRLGGETLA